MKVLLVACLLFLLLPVFSYSQKIEKFYDYKWNPCEQEQARFVAVINHTDSGWLRDDYYIQERSLQMTGLYADSACKIAIGNFRYFYSNHNLKSTGKYKDNKKEGLWLSFHDNGFMSDSSVFENGKRTGIALGWYRDGAISDSTIYNADGSAVAVEWFENGHVSSAGRLNTENKMTGKWAFYHANGRMSALENYDNGILIDKKYFSDTGIIMDTTDHTSNPIFPGGIEKWTRYLGKNIYWPANYKIVNADKAAVVIAFTINETGEIKNAHVETSFHEAFDKVALQAVKFSPKWNPGFNHNRNVRFNWTQTIHFQQVQY